MATPQELGVLIREARLAKGMSLGQLASAVGRSSSSVRRWERGEVAPAASVLPKLAAILEIDGGGVGDDGDSAKGESQGEPSEGEPSEGEPSEGEPSEGERAEPTGSDGRVATVEQPEVVGADPPDVEHEAPSQPLAKTGGGIFTDVWRVLTRGGRGWEAWIRGLLTAAVLVVMLFVMIWALGELFDALAAVLDSFDVGSNGGND